MPAGAGGDDRIGQFEQFGATDGFNRSHRRCITPGKINPLQAAYQFTEDGAVCLRQPGESQELQFTDDRNACPVTLRERLGNPSSPRSKATKALVSSRYLPGITLLALRGERIAAPCESPNQVVNLNTPAR